MTIEQAGYEVVDQPSTSATGSSPAVSKVAWGDWIARLGVFLVCLLHTVTVAVGMGGLSGLSNEWPILRNDHGIHYQHGLVACQFLRSTGTAAGYDPSFMSGYPLSIVSDLSSTLSDFALLASGDRPARGYKIYVLVCAASVPWLMALASIAWKARPSATFLTVLFTFFYFWTDFPYRYAVIGMLGYLVSVPLGLLAVAGLAAYCDKGGFGRWLWASASGSGVFLAHMTSPMLVAPAGLLAYGVAIFVSRKEGRPFPLSRHLGLWLMAPLILALNAFWLVPGYLLASTKGPSDFAFAHSEQGVLKGVLKRIGEIVWSELPIQPVLLGLAPIGLVVLRRRQPVAAAALGGFLAAGFGWGYLAGAFPSLDPLQPGRHTYACYSAACIAAGIGLSEVLAKLRSGRSPRLDPWVALASVVVGIRLFGPWLENTARTAILAEVPFLSSRPSARTLWVVSMVKKHVRPGERLLFEETGLGVPGLGDPFGERHISPILPEMTGVEVIGGPYLHATVTTNFTQFGENKLFHQQDWGRDFFERHARLYRPSAICCWSPRARAFCVANPDLIRIVEDDGVLLLGRVKGFEGSTIQGTAEVEAGPNRLVVRNAVAGPTGDGKVILRYHAVPYLRATPPATIEEVLLEDDPVPFIRISPTPGPVTIEMVLPSPFRAGRPPGN